MVSEFLSGNMNSLSHSDDLFYHSSNTSLSADVEHHLVSTLFTSDLQQVALNCITYNTEVTLIVAQAQKLLFAIHRYTDRWLFASDRPSVDLCDDKNCLLTFEVINPHVHGSAVRCGKCTGVYSYNSVFNTEEGS